MSNVNIDWRGIRALNGSQSNGFEELCAQLARVEAPAGSRFERKGSPDGGVECYAVVDGASEWGWQAKYFHVLGDSQWTQLDQSIKTALEKHPRLVRYFVCVPLDRADARIRRQQSAMERWALHVQKWEGWAAALAISVEFVFWGSHELLDRLQRPEHVGRVRFWFDVRRFDGAWFHDHLQEAIEAAGPRYTPEIHVDLPVANEFEGFGRSDRFFNTLKALALRLRKKAGPLIAARENEADQILANAVAALAPRVQALLGKMGAIQVQSTGSLPFSDIADVLAEVGSATDELERLLLEREREHDAKPSAPTPDAGNPTRGRNPFRSRRLELVSLSDEFRAARQAFAHAEVIAAPTLMVLRGEAGSGKTHLLCDVATRRVAADQPTVLLMGQQFLTREDPWTQTLQQLDLAGLSAEEFVGALEAAAQVAGHRALFMMDAINEGSGRQVWPSHLAAFLARLERSPWIGVVLSVRSSYEEMIVPNHVRARALSVTHRGFAEHEYDATRTFFVHYGLELPSTPLLAPEFRNPLFLKTVCSGLKARGKRRFPRGLYGITAVFAMYLDGVNTRLAADLNFNPKTPLVEQALGAISLALIESGKRWLPLGKAAETVNALLQGREYDRSLYHGLVSEGVLVEEGARHQKHVNDESTFIAYDRLADHLVATRLLDRHLDLADPASAFSLEGPLAFLCDDDSVVPGLLEAMCIQVPERTGRELPSLVPRIMESWGIADAFRQSLVWRAATAFTKDTRTVLKLFSRSEPDLDATLDVLLTISTLPEHPLNARYLDERLRRDTMPERDAWWSTYLHRAWRGHGAVDRLVDWASSVTPNDRIEDETLDLCATSLAWMLTTANRFLRDRATKALVGLLTDRLAAAVRLLDRFTDVDDPYVVERVYAVAYGIAMRSHNPIDVGKLGTCVYTRVFADGNPPVHILLRDYARGIVERAIHLGSRLEIAVQRVRPPYSAPWPTIPSDAEIHELSSSQIGYSAMHWDFARYVIGTNSSSESHHWLSLRLDATAWQAPPATEDLLQTLTAGLSDVEREAWERFDAADQAYGQEMVLSLFTPFLPRNDDSRSQADDSPPGGPGREPVEMPPARPGLFEEARKVSLETLKLALTTEHRRLLDDYLTSKNADQKGRQPPRFDLREIQRYVVWRAFDLGWTAQRFEHFDRLVVRHESDKAQKAERIGKKYQWIAYHEILARVADNFRYMEQFSSKAHAYEGPWQLGLRDIDPSCTLKASHQGTSWEGHVPAWWGPSLYTTWGETTGEQAWIRSCEDLPALQDLLCVANPADGSKWLNVDGYLNWRQPTPIDQDSTEVERRDLWYNATGYLIRSAVADDFMKWAEGVDFWGRWMPDGPDLYGVFLGEHGWAQASRSFQEQYVRDGAWRRPEHGCPAEICSVMLGYLGSGNGFDCSIDEGFHLRLPCTDVMTGMDLRWNAIGADYLTPAGRLAVQDPTVRSDGPSALLFREDLLRESLGRQGLTICWAVIGEKRVLSAGGAAGRGYLAALRMSGAYAMGKKGPVGFLKCFLERPRGGNDGSPSELVKTIRISE